MLKKGERWSAQSVLCKAVGPGLAVGEREPIHDANDLGAISSRTRSLLMPATCHVLIIEDEPLIAMQVRDILEDEGATSFAFAATQEAAVALAVSHPPTLITSDVKLIQGTGPLAVDAIHRALGDIPVIFITATPADCEPCAPPGQVLSKPVDQHQLAATFRKMAV